MNIVSWNAKNVFTVFLMVAIGMVVLGFVTTGAKMVIMKYKGGDDAK